MTPPRLDPSALGETPSAGEIARFLRRVLRRWPLMVGAVALSLIALAAYVRFRNPSFRSETVLLYTPGVSSTEATAPSTGPRNVTVRLKELLFSRPKLAGLLSTFDLYRDVQQKYGKEDAVDELKRHIEFRAPGGDTFSIAFVGGTPQQARQVTEALARIVIDGDAELRKTQVDLAQEFLATEKSSKASELKAAEQRLAAFMADHRRFALDATPLVAGAAIRATDMPAPLPPAAPGMPWRPSAAPRVSTPVSAGGAPQDDDRARAVAALAAAKANLAEQLLRFTPAHPDVQAAQGEVDRATARVAALGPEIRPTPAPTPPAPNTAASNGSAPPRRTAAPAPRATTSPAGDEDVVALETEWSKLTREVTAARQRLDQVEAALFRADVLANSERAGRAVQISVIDPAFLPERPLGMTTTVLAALFLGAGIFIGVLAAALGAALDDRIYADADIAGITDLLTEVPRMSARRRHHVPG